MSLDSAPSVCPKNQQEWRNWLEENHAKETAVWLIVYKKTSATPTITWSQSVDEALCFGWIDSVKRPIDAEKYKQYFGRRKPKSTWSKINKQKIEKLQRDGLMAEAGLRSVEVAKQNGSWNILDQVEDLIVPQDLDAALKKIPSANNYFLGLSKSVKKGFLHWVVMAKRPETRQKRIAEIAENAAKNQKPKHFR